MLAQEPDIRLIARQTGAMNTGLLASAHADHLAALCVADGVGLRVFQRNQGNQQVALCIFRDILVVRHHIGEHGFVDFDLIAALLKRDTVYILALHRSRLIVRVDLHHIVVALTLRLEDFQRFVGITGGDDAVGYLAGQQRRGFFVADVGQRRPVAIGGHAVCTACACISARNRGQFQVVHKIDLLFHIAQRQANRRSRRADMLKGSRCRKAGGLFQLLDQLPAIERIQEIDIAGFAVEDLDRQFAAVLHKNAGRLLIRVAPIFQQEFVCHFILLLFLILVHDPGFCLPCR